MCLFYKLKISKPVSKAKQNSFLINALECSYFIRTKSKEQKNMNDILPWFKKEYNVTLSSDYY